MKVVRGHIGRSGLKILMLFFFDYPLIFLLFGVAFSLIFVLVFHQISVSSSGTKLRCLIYFQIEDKITL